MKTIIKAILLAMVLSLILAVTAGCEGLIPTPTEPEEPTAAPTEPAEPTNPEEPTEPPVDPTEPPVDPTEPPVDPTEPPVDPTEPPHTHSYEAVVTSPTCTAAGYTTYTCACGDSYTADEVAATGHTWVAGTTVAPTFDAQGYTEYACACGETKQDDFVAAKVAVATANGTKYETFAEAFAAGGEIVLLADVELNAPLTIEGTMVIDLNGKTLSYTSEVMGEAMITNKGNLTINDSAETGVINYNYVGTNDASYGKGNYTISNGGTLTVNGGKITGANLRQHAKYPIDNNNTTGDAILVINGGWIYNYNTSAIRMFCNSTTYRNSVTINGGLVEGYCAIWMQNPGSKTMNGELTITDGEIKTTAAAWVNGTAALKDVSSAIYCTIAGEGGAWSESSFINISGGTFNENVSLSEAVPAVTISGGVFNGYVEHAHDFIGYSCTTDGTCACGATKVAGHTWVDVEAKAATCTVDGYTAHRDCANCDAVEGKEVIPATGHSGYEADYKCDTCSAKVLPADGEALTIPQALAIAKLHAHNTYTTQKYYITGIVTNLYNTQYGNFYIKDAEGNQICIYGLYSADGKTRYDKMSYKPVEGDEVTVYTVLGTYNSTYQGKNAWLDEVVAHEHDYVAVVTAPGCLTDGYTTHTCSICKASYVDSEVPALGHTTDNGICENCGQEIGGDAPAVGTLAEFNFGSNGSAAHVDGNAFGTTKSYTVGTYTLTLTNMSKVYGPAYDAKGNSCIKLGTSSTIGSLKFTVPENVTQVEIHVAKYKANATKISINGGAAQSLTKASNDGAYDVIVVDTTTNKTVSFATVSGGVRCMINTIVFIGTAN